MTNNTIKDAELKKFIDNDTQKPSVRVASGVDDRNEINKNQLAMVNMLGNILEELQKINLQLSFITDEEL